MALRTYPIRRFGTRPNLFIGCDRELVLFAGLLAFAIGITGMEVKAITYAVVFWIICLVLLRMMAKADPMMRHVYLRHRRYKAYYPAHSTPYCKKRKKGTKNR